MYEEMGQEDVDNVFEWIVASEERIDDVMESLAAVGISIRPEYRKVVVRWLDMFDEDSPVPLKLRLAMLKGWLSALAKRDGL